MLNTYSCVVGSMKKWKPIGITALEYREYRQNGCIRVKDYPKPNKKKRDPEVERIPFNIYEVLDFDEKKNGKYSDFFWSFSFGYISVKKVEDFYKISVVDESKKSLVIQRLRRFRLDPELDSETGVIYADRLITI
jgi:hypothetical protein